MRCGIAKLELDIYILLTQHYFKYLLIIYIDNTESRGRVGECWFCFISFHGVPEMMNQEKFSAYVATHSRLSGISWDNSLTTEVYVDEISVGKAGMYEFAAMDDGTIFKKGGHPENWDICDYLPEIIDSRVYLELLYSWLTAQKTPINS